MNLDELSMNIVRYIMLLGKKIGLVVFSFFLVIAINISSVSAATRDVSFTWTPNSDDPPVDGYNLFYKIGDPGTTLDNYRGTTDASGGNPSPVFITGQTTGTYTLQNLLESQKYSFILTSYRGGVDSAPTDPITLAADTTPAETRSVSFSWTANSDDPPVDGYHLFYKLGDPGASLDDYRGTTDASSGNPSPVAISGQSTTTYTLPNLLKDQKYSFVLTSFRGTVDSVPTEAIVLEATTAGNTAPVAQNSTITTDEDTAYTGQLSASDADGDSLTYALASNGSKGSAAITNSSTGGFTYTPNPGVSGSDSFTFRVNDGSVDSATATVSVTVTPVNDTPTASNKSISTPEDTVYSGQLSGSDPDGDSLTYSIVANGGKGTANIANPATGAFTYTPNSGISGSDSFTFRVNDGKVNSNTATVTVAISAVNDAPTAASTTILTEEDTSLSGQLSGSDPDGDSLTYTIVSNGSKGTAAITNAGTGAFTYTPNSGVSGSDSFTFRVNDGTVNSNIATVSVSISSVNDAPTATAASFIAAEDTTYSGQLSGSDPDGDSLTFALAYQPGKGAVSITNINTGAFTYTPETNATGSDSFAFRVSDGQVSSANATVNITITATNDAPTANSATFTTAEEAAYSGILSASDPDGDSLTFSIVNSGTKGTAAITNASSGAFTYTPDENATGGDSFTFRVSDGSLNSSNATVNVTISPKNDAPTAVGGNITTNEDTAYSGQLSANDPDGDSLTYTLVSNGSKGTASITNAGSGAFTYTPNADEHGTDTFTFRVSDGTVNSNNATVNVTITSVNDKPTAGALSISTSADAAYSGVLPASDPENDGLTYSIVANGSKGSAVINNSATGAFTYTPISTESGEDTFTFKVNDGTVDSSVGTVTVTISEAGTLPPPPDLIMVEEIK